ncbi:HNH endonuclease [Lactobacillus sp. PV034]|uniref:HNH endonuclease n=1 Tax=Lactobacillus sp. PV034 TaxID=2594495 RepID=UPI0022404FF8|nr:HNH endonuclease [Lactobacillus sp. PV034]QNQ81061.1 HNH endonuclease [Lactobacillus sp. PV034]
MKLQCASCGLRINSLHFKQDGLINPKLTSICDICLSRGLEPNDYENKVVQDLALIMLYGYTGKKTTSLNLEEENFLVKPDQRKAYEAFIQDYDGNEVAQQQVTRDSFNQAVAKSEDQIIDYVPRNNVDFAVNMQNLGLEINFSLNELDYIEREQIRRKYNYRCQYCGRKGTSVDHKDPVSLSQNNDPENLILSCSECNRIKSNMPYDLFVELNNRLTTVNERLVQYENTLANLKEEFVQAKRDLAGQVHLRGVINDPELNAMRKQNKKLHDAIDSLQSDYDALRNTRKNYFESGWKLAKENQSNDII